MRYRQLINRLIPFRGRLRLNGWNRPVRWTWVGPCMAVFALPLLVELEFAAGQSLLESFFNGLRPGTKQTTTASDPSQPSRHAIPNADNAAFNPKTTPLERIVLPMPPGDVKEQIPSNTTLPGQIRIPVQPETDLHLPPPQDTQEELPALPESIEIPLTEIGTPGEVKIQREKNGLISLVVRDASLSRVLSLFAQSLGLNIIAANDIDAVVSITLHEVPVDQALSAILSVANYTWVVRNDIIYVTSIADASKLPAGVQDRQIQVFPLDYASGKEISSAIQAFLSPVGQVFHTECDEMDNRKTQEAIVVEDLPQNLMRVASLIHQIDQPPRQVQIEAHILQVDLKDNRNHGVNFEHLFNVMGNSVSLSTIGFANPSATQAFFASIEGGNLISLIEILKTTTNAKTLASPKLTVLNSQMAHIHVGEQLGYRVTTTTDTSTLESVDFLDVGVVLTITPRISRDNRVLLSVKPEVSSGQISPVTGVPEEETTELETSVMLEDGYGMVIGGLIQETDSVIQNKIPYLGDLWMVGRLFQKQQVIKDRAEIIVVLIPRVLPMCGADASYEQGEIARAGTELFEGPLLRKARPWQPKLPDALENPRKLSLPPVGSRYPYPAYYVENAATPQPQMDYQIPPHPGPPFRDSDSWYGYPCQVDPDGNGSYSVQRTGATAPNPKNGTTGSAPMQSAATEEMRISRLPPVDSARE